MPVSIYKNVSFRPMDSTVKAFKKKNMLYKPKQPQGSYWLYAECSVGHVSIMHYSSIDG